MLPEHPAQEEQKFRTENQLVPQLHSVARQASPARGMRRKHRAVAHINVVFPSVLDGRREHRELRRAGSRKCTRPSALTRKTRKDVISPHTLS